MSAIVEFYKSLYRQGKISGAWLTDKVNLDTSANGKKAKQDKNAIMGKITATEKDSIVKG